MGLIELLGQIESERGAVTVAGLAQRLETSPARVTAMLDALRAAGLLGPEVDGEPGNEVCPDARTCSTGPCPGPSLCPFVVRFGSTLELK